MKASEIGDYVYCPRAWWLRFTGVITGKTEAMIEGTTQHELLATKLANNHRSILIAWSIIGLGIVLFVSVLLMFVFFK